MDPVIIAHGACQFGTDMPDLAVAWIKALAGIITGPNFLDVVKDVNPDNLDQMRQMVAKCLDPAA